MRAWLVFIIFGCFLTQGLGRPPQTDYSSDNNVDEEEGDNETAADDSLADDEDTRLSDQDQSIQEEEALNNRHLADSRYRSGDRPAYTNTDNFSEYKTNKNPDANSNSQILTSIKTRESEKYTDTNDASDQQEAAQHLTNGDVNKANRVQNQRVNHNLFNKRTLNEEGDMLFQTNKEQGTKIAQNECNNNEALDASEQNRYFNQYYNTMQAENRGMADDKSHESAHYNLRDRRDIIENQNDAINTQSHEENLDQANTDDEKAAIKRHIKKLSEDELEQLLNSLSEEKRELLKKIIHDGDAMDNGYVNKREITKKSGAVEENNFVETGQSELSKIQSGSSVNLNSESSVQNTETTEATKSTELRTESSDVSSSITAETNNVSNNKEELTSRNDEAVQKKADVSTFASNLGSKNQAEIATQVTSKTENKRETNLDDFENMDTSLDDSAFLGSDAILKDEQDYSNDDGYFCSQDENLSQFLDDNSKSQDEESKTYKREVFLDNQPNLADSIKSLQESFPNSNAYDESAPYSGPLIRVKRKNSDQIVKKRSAGLLPDAKVAYFPYKAENEDEDNEEGNEFDDEGFYDRTPNFGNSNKAVEDDTSSSLDISKQPQRSDKDDNKSSNDNPETDSVSLGSDTDNVLSGVEGVDDNLMYNTQIRSRRSAEDNRYNDDEPIMIKSMLSTGDLTKTNPENYMNLPHYQANDAFGPLPRSYDGDLGRYKRIRRVKQSRNSDDLTSSDTTV